MNGKCQALNVHKDEITLYVKEAFGHYRYPCEVGSTVIHINVSRLSMYLPTMPFLQCGLSLVI